MAATITAEAHEPAPAVEPSRAIRRQLNTTSGFNSAPRGYAAHGAEAPGAKAPVGKLAAAGMGFLALAALLTGCASYTEAYGQVLSKREEDVSSLVPAGRVLMPQTITKRYLEIEYILDGEVIHEELSVDASAYEGCDVDDYILREESGAISCHEKSWR